MVLFYLGTFATSTLFSFILTKYVRDVATSRGWVAAPALDRHLHRRPLPRLGGVAIFLSFVLSFAVRRLLRWHYPELGLGLPFKTTLTILLPGSLIFFLGLYDDIRSIGPYTKFAVQAVAGAMLFAGGLRILSLPLLFGSHHLSWFVDLPLTIVWVIAVTNAFNLIDGLDGLAAGSALFSTVVVFAVALITGSSSVSLMALCLAGAILGFLRFNFSPATIFLGDCGSLFIGFVLSALALQGAEKAPTIIAVAIPMVSFGLPILETALSVVRRFISGRRFLSPTENIFTTSFCSAVFLSVRLPLLSMLSQRCLRCSACFCYGRLAAWLAWSLPCLAWGYGRECSTSATWSSANCGEWRSGPWNGSFSLIT